MSSVLRACRVLLAPTRARSAAAAASAADKPKAKPKAKSQTSSAARTNTGGLMKPYQVSPRLASFLGVSQSSRPNAVKQVWAHIKLYNLQNPANKKEINCDPKLKLLFEGRNTVHMLEVSKFLSSHFVKTA